MEETLMKITALIGTAILLALFGIAPPAYSQEQHDQDQPTKAQDANAPHDDPKQQAEPPKTPNDQPHPEVKDAKPPRDEHPKAEETKTDRPTKQAQRIPNDKFKAHFGREHTFHVGHPVIVGGRPRFSYGGYSFFIAQPWPTGWGYNDDVYVEDINGVYYLMDVAHPGVQLELSVVL
jgi:hypothetical protein